MAITTAICNSYKLELLGGTHQAGDVYKMALYTSSAALDKTTTVYSATNEVSGAGYTAGGITLAGEARALDGDTAMLDFSDPTWSAATITAAGCLIYNSSRANKAVAAYSFGGNVTSTGGNFTVQIPVAAAATALVRVT